MSRYLRFEEVRDTGRTKVWQVVSVNHGDVLAMIKWWGPWREYVFSPRPETVWNRDCMDDVKAFIDARMAERKTGVQRDDSVIG